MKKTLFLIILLNLTNYIYCQDNITVSKYKEETKLVINYILENYIQDNYLNIIKTATPVQVKNCPETYESSILYDDEKEYVRKTIKNPQIIYWTNDFFPNCKIIEDEEAEQQYSGSIARFSSPIFLRNYEIVIIKFSISSGNLSGYGFEAIFTRKDKGWFIYSCSWDN